MQKYIVVLLILLVFGAGFGFAQTLDTSERVGTDRSKYDLRSACGDDDCRKGDSIPATIELRQEACFTDRRLGEICIPEGVVLSVLFYDEQ